MKARWTLTAGALAVAGVAQAASYPVMAPASAYLMADRAAEIALARTAAPPSVSNDATVMVLGPQGYVTGAAGRNGFVCIVERAWFSGLTDGGFWNPKLRAPDCYNPQAARSVLPVLLTRTKWALAGASQSEIRRRTRALMAAGRIPAPAAGSMNFMLSKQGYLGDDAGGPWRPHVMFYMPPSMRMSDWGANLAGTRVAGTAAGIDPYTMFYVLVGVWSDGTPDERSGAKPAM